MEQISYTYAAAIVEKRPKDSNKGTFGRLCCVCGSAVGNEEAGSQMAGAAVLCGGAALRCGAGLVEMVIPHGIYPVVASALPEAVCTVYPNTGFLDAGALLSRASACVVGCGLSERFPEKVEAVLRAAKEAKTPLLLDADALNCIAHSRPLFSLLDSMQGPLVLTPHPGEMARLCGTTVAAVQAHREETARAFAKAHHCILVLKGAGTIVAAPDGRALQNPTGNPGLARGGSGDLLSGMIGAFFAQGRDPFHAACAGVYLHGLAGDRCAARLSEQAMLPRDVLAALPPLFLEIETRRP